MIEILKSTISDNYFYAIHHDNDVVLIDPIDSDVAIQHVKDSGRRLRAVLNTHFHPDHVGGNDAVLAAFPDAELVAGADSVRIEGVTKTLGDGEVYPFGDGIKTVDTFGHTMGHVTFLWRQSSEDVHLFIGDALFFCGTGHCKFGGEPSLSFRTFRDVMSKFPDEATFYPGHDYAVRNLEFAASVDNRVDLDSWKSRVIDHGSPAWRIEDDRSVNPFWKFSDPELQQQLIDQHPDLFEEELGRCGDREEATFCTLRELRNRW